MYMQRLYNRHEIIFSISGITSFGGIGPLLAQNFIWKYGSACLVFSYKY